MLLCVLYVILCDEHIILRLVFLEHCCSVFQHAVYLTIQSFTPII